MTAGNGTCQTGVGLCAKLTITGDVSHFFQVCTIRAMHKYSESMNRASHHNLKIGNFTIGPSSRILAVVQYRQCYLVYSAWLHIAYIAENLEYDTQYVFKY